MLVLPELADTFAMGGGDDASAHHQVDQDHGKFDESLWSLTLNEIELKSGKSFGSMNMEEFLATVWSNAELDHHHQPQPNHTHHHQNDMITNSKLPSDDHHDTNPISIPSPLCNKTVDEVWFDLQKEQLQSLHHHYLFNPTTTNNNTNNNGVPHERQHSLGEMTLEDFLVQAGVVSSSSSTTTTTPPPSSSSTLQQQKTEFHGNSFSNVTGSYQMMMNPGRVYAGEGSSSELMMQGEFDHLDDEETRGRIFDGPPEVLVERRQRRMIKNRESAARSRARKQAYTMELELEFNFLKEENSKLKQILEIEQKTREKIMSMKKEANKKTNKLRSIRRTTSMWW